MDSQRTPRSPSKDERGGGANPWDVESDISVLFCRHSVEEVRRREQGTRLDIERKKEELRQMVGERYRDLIEAADSIMDLQTYSEQVEGAMERTAALCHSLQQSYFLRGFGGMQGPPARNDTHSIAAQMKLLSCTPEKIWYCLETHRYLQATHLYLLACHTHSQLRLNQQTPLTQQLWQSVACFKSTILDCCTNHLQSPGTGVPDMLSSLSASLLLNGCTLRQVFMQFLLAQKAALQAVFHPTKQMHCSVKSQVCEMVGVVRRSLIHTAFIFCLEPGQDKSSLLHTMEEVTNGRDKDHLIDLIPDDLYSRLPDSVKNFVPAVRNALSEIPSSDVHSSCEEWLAACAEDIRQGVSQLLQHVTTVKGLGKIRQSVHSLLAQPENSDNEGDVGSSSVQNTSWPDQWSELSTRVLGRNLSIWNHFLQPLFLGRAKAILSKHFSSTEEHASKTLNDLLNGMTSDPTLYLPDSNVCLKLWEEDQGIPGRSVLEGGEREGEGERGEILNPLALKAKACTPSVYSFCRTVGEKLQLILDDASHYLEPSTQPSHCATPSLQVGEFPFRLHGDDSDMQEFLRESTNQCISRFLDKMNQQVLQLQSELKSKQIGTAVNAIDRLLLIARVCHSLTEFCTPLSLLSTGNKLSPSTPARGLPSSRRGKKTMSLLKQQEDSPEGNTTKQLLRARITSIHKIWAVWCADQVALQFREQFLSSSELTALSSTLVWEEITISEEAESGKQVSSSIRVPSQASVYVCSLLYAACQEVSRIGGHAMERSVLVFFSGHVLRSVLDTHLSLLSSLGTLTSLPQPCALQLLFNVKFLSSILASPQDMEEEKNQQLHSVTEQLQNFIDPFDMDVFMPYLLSALERQLQRSTVLFGMLLALKGPSHLLTGQKPPLTTTQEKHIVIPLARTAPRFPSLPLSSPAKNVKPSSKHIQLPDGRGNLAPRTFLETAAFFHHL